MIFREMKASGVVPDLGSYNTLLRSCASSGDIDRAEEILREILDPANDLVPNDRTWRAVLRTAGKAKRSDVVLQTWQAAVADMGGGHNSNTDREKEADAAASKTDVTSPPSSTKSKKQTQRKSNNLSLQTFRTLLMALLICAWDLRESDRHTSVELYKIIIKCYNALRSSSASSSSQSNIEQLQQQKGLYMGMHLVDSRAAMDNPQVLASILQAIVNLESLLERDDAWKGKLRQLGISIAGERCLLGSSGNGERSSSLSYFDKKALNTAESWYAEETKPS
jgi:pentatricopeptide repeat protein